jgi:hypothetical protein
MRTYFYSFLLKEVFIKILRETRANRSFIDLDPNGSEGIQTRGGAGSNDRRRKDETAEK